ncbi:MAG: MlaD family protein, partial [Gemmatimonadota bacterium]|nr:MlaD family protein [Gemmatimonadota bacterium]
MSRRASPRAIGAFVVAGTALAIASVAVFGSGRLFSRTHQFVSYFDANVGGLDPGAPVKFSGVPVGSVEGVFLGLGGIQSDPSASGIPVVYNIDANLIAGRGGSVDLSDPAMIDSLISDLGMAASLATESLVTGRQYIELGMYRDRQRRFAEVPGSEYVEIPTVRTGFEEIQSQLQDLV